MRRFIPVALAAAALLLLDVTSAAAQASQWRITPFAGGSVVGEVPPVAENTVEFANGFAVGVSAMFRKGHFGLEAQGHFVPTEATSASGFVLSEEGQAIEDPEGAIFIARQNDQNLLFGSLSGAYFSGNSWGENQPFVPREWYVIGGVGLVRFGNHHPFRELGEGELDPDTKEVDGWKGGDVEPMFNFGAGLQFNVLGTLSIQFELRDYVFNAIERNASTEQTVQEGRDVIVTRWHNNVVLRQGVTFVIF